MEEWLLFLRGPVFRLAIVIFLLGLGRELFLAIWGVVSAYRRANDRKLPWKQMLLGALSWLVPVKRLFTSNRKAHGFLSFLMHVGVILVPLFLLDHILLWKNGLGLRWPAIPQYVADTLTLLTILVVVGLIISRAFSRTARPLSKAQDYILLLLIFFIFGSGFIASKPWNPMSYEASMIIHTLSGNILLISAPFTKLAHIAVYPIKMVSVELAWKFPSRAGEQVALTLDGKEVRPI